MICKLLQYIKITKSKKTLEYYHNYWINILKLIGNDCNFIMKQMLNDMQIHTDYVKETKSKKTLEYYRSYWSNILKLISNDCNTIINHK